MKRAISLMLSLLMCLALCACSQKSTSRSRPKTMEDRAVFAAQTLIQVHYVNNGKGLPSVSASATDMGNGVFQVSGTANGAYFNGTVKYNAANDSFSADYNSIADDLF